MAEVKKIFVVVASSPVEADWASPLEIQKTIVVAFTDGSEAQSFCDNHNSQPHAFSTYEVEETLLDPDRD